MKERSFVLFFSPIARPIESLSKVQSSLLSYLASYRTLLQLFFLFLAIQNNYTHYNLIRKPMFYGKQKILQRYLCQFSWAAVWTFLKYGFPWCSIVYRDYGAIKGSFYQPAPRLCKTSVCTKHKYDPFGEFRPSKHGIYSICVPCFGKSTRMVTMQNIGASISLTSSEELQSQHSYGKPICRLCQDDVTISIDSVRDAVFSSNISNNIFFWYTRVN